MVAAGHFASQYANQTMDASGIGHPHGGRGGPPAAARRGGGAGTAGHRGGAGGGDGGDGDGGDAGGSPAVAWPDYGEDFPPDPGWDYDEPGGYDSGGYDSGGYDPGPDYGDPGTGSGDGGYGWTADDAAVQSGRGPGSGASSA